MIQAASLPETYFTVWGNVFVRGRLQPGETILVHGGSSGIGTTAIQLCKAKGARVIVTVGSDAKKQACIDCGADLVVNYKTQDWVEEALAFTDRKGCDVILDMVAGDYIARDIACAAQDARIVIIATQGGAAATVDCAAICRKRIVITGSLLRPQTQQQKAAICDGLLRNVWPLFDSKQLRSNVHSVFPASECVQAHQLMDSGDFTGKIVLSWEHPQ